MDVLINRHKLLKVPKGVFYAWLFFSLAFSGIFASTASAEDSLVYDPIVEIKNITNTSMTFQITMDAREVVSDYIDVFYTIAGTGASGGYIIRPGQTIEMDLPEGWIFEGTSYEYTVRFRDPVNFGTLTSTTGTFTTTGDAPTPAVHTVSFENVDGERALVARGEDFLAARALSDYLSTSLVELNGQPLPACSNNLPYPYDLYLQAGIAPGLVSQQKPCYYLVHDGGMEAALTFERAVVFIPEDFDETAQGTIKIKGVPLYTFNENAGQDDSTPEPVIISSGNSELKDGAVLSSRPIFSGKAPAGSTVTVTVHSDPVSCTTTADENGNWSCQLPADLLAGAHTAYVRVLTTSGEEIELGPYDVSVGTLSGVLAPNTGARPFERVGLSFGAIVALLAGIVLVTAAFVVARVRKMNTVKHGNQ